MRVDRTVERYRRWYASLLRLYPTSYYKRFGGEMEQTFGDLLREQPVGQAFTSSISWLFLDTLRGIISEHLRGTSMHTKIIRALLHSTAFLVVPLTASLFVDGWLWSGGDYVFAWILFSLVSLAFTFVASSTKSKPYKLGAGMAVMTAFFLIWISGAVGIIGDPENGSAFIPNLMYLGLLAVGFLGVVISRLQPGGMARTLFVLAVGQMIVPLAALVLVPGAMTANPGLLGIFTLNALFALLWLGSGLLMSRESHSPIALRS